MRFRNSTRLLTENFKNVYKILLYTLAVALVAIAVLHFPSSQPARNSRQYGNDGRRFRPQRIPQSHRQR